MFMTTTQMILAGLTVVLLVLYLMRRRSRLSKDE
jgi:hypothetical protein